ncbi:MAG: hypothetical protein WBR26_18340 [Candidatus Acidiferrum sp.]
MNEKTSTAALDFVRRGTQKPAPRCGPPVQPVLHGRTAGLEEATATPRRQSRLREDTMNMIPEMPSRNWRRFLTVVVRVTFSVALWTLGVAAKDIRAAPVRTEEQHVVVRFAVDRAQAEELQRWVEAGHDAWCRDPQLVAAAALRRVAPELAQYELASTGAEMESSTKTSAVYVFHSLDGHTTYRITLRRHLYLLRTAGSLQRVVWMPENLEILRRETHE